MNLREATVPVALRMVLGLAALSGVVFGFAGRWDLPFVWAVCGMFAAAMLGSLASIDRGLMQERMRPGPGGKDRYLRVIVLPLFAAHLAVAGLDRRYEWTQLSMWMQSAGLAGLPLRFSLSIWAARVNRFFSPVVRLQPERGHHVVTTGPYAVIRHPGYLASGVMLPCSGLAFGSLWSLLPFVPLALLLVRRIVIEDRFLQERLQGYSDYARRVRFRVLPGIW